MGSQRRILIVDDEQELTRTLGDFFLAHDYRVYQAVSGEEAIGHLNNIPVDIVLLDLRLPRAQGLGLLEMIRRRDANLPVIIVTAYASSHADRLRELKPTKILEKPLSLTSLMKAISEAEGRPAAPAAPSDSSEGILRILMVDPVEATATALKQELEKRNWPGREYVIDQALSRENARRLDVRPDLVLINLDVLREGRTVAMEHLTSMQMGGRSWRPRDVVCYGAATSEEAKRRLESAGVGSIELEVSGQGRIERLAETIENFATRRSK
ncbi:MAG: response regulator [Candidatus Omnitrophica bacterium]|nr:response regulator [Candidatus Omnitrophota bacterium]